METFSHMPQESMLEYTALEWSLEDWAVECAKACDKMLANGELLLAPTAMAILGVYIRNKLGKMAGNEWVSICQIAILVAQSLDPVEPAQRVFDTVMRRYVERNPGEGPFRWHDSPEDHKEDFRLGIEAALAGKATSRKVKGK